MGPTISGVLCSMQKPQLNLSHLKYIINYNGSNCVLALRLECQCKCIFVCISFFFWVGFKILLSGQSLNSKKEKKKRLFYKKAHTFKKPQKPQYYIFLPKQPFTRDLALEKATWPFYSLSFVLFTILSLPFSEKMKIGPFYHIHLSKI